MPRVPKPRTVRPAQAPEPVLHLTVRFRERSSEDVVRSYCSDVMRGGMLIRTTRDPLLQLGSRVRLRFLLAGGEEIFNGIGMVAWMQRRSSHLGVGVHFEKLSEQGEQLYRQMLALRQEQERLNLRRWMAAEDRHLTSESFDGPTSRVDSPLPFLV